MLSFQDYSLYNFATLALKYLNIAEINTCFAKAGLALEQDFEEVSYQLRDSHGTKLEKPEGISPGRWDRFMRLAHKPSHTDMRDVVRLADALAYMVAEVDPIAPESAGQLRSMFDEDGFAWRYGSF